MTTRVARALVLHELLERLRDRWVLVGAGLFVLLAGGVGLYGRSAEASAAAVTAPSLVTLASFLVPLVALVLGHDAIVGERERNTLGLLLSLPVRRGEVLFAKTLGRFLALALAVVLGLGFAALLLPAGQRATLLALAPPTVLLGASFLSLGVLISVVSRRHATAASLAVALWFLMVLFWDLGLLAGLVATDGALPQDAVAALVTANPAGLYRLSLLLDLTGASDLASLGLTVALPTALGRGLIWSAWIVGPLVVGAWILGRPKGVVL